MAVVTLFQSARQHNDALAACDVALRHAPTDDTRGMVSLRRARSLRDLGRTDAALALYTALGEHATDRQTQMLAWWEAAREAQDDSRWRDAARWFDRAHELSTGLHDGETTRVRDAPALAGLMYWLSGDRETAAERWKWGDETSTFWRAIHLRQRGDARGDSILRAQFAERPGYRFHQVAARETLGVRGWTGRVAPAGAEAGDTWLVDAVQALVGPLALPREASRVVSARDRRDPRLPAGSSNGIPDSTWRSLAAAFYESGDLAGATRAADRHQADYYGVDAGWAWQPWAYPPAFERELIAAADPRGIERALLWALARQESRFDPRAISRSNALGLAQLLPGTAREVAHELRETLSSDSLLFEPDRGLRYGAHYLKKLLKRFDGAVPVALTAYNAGPSKVRKDWRSIVDVGGWALYCEMGSNADTQEYVQNIVGFRQAYRELRPTSGAQP
jgi:soluble lytic murein transglycosylase-like protein